VSGSLAYPTGSAFSLFVISQHNPTPSPFGFLHPPMDSTDWRPVFTPIRWRSAGDQRRWPIF